MSDALAHVMDVAATILDVADVAHPETFAGEPVAAMQGVSLAPVFANTVESVRGPTDWIGWELFGNRAVKMGDWKLLWLCEPAGTGDWQLYDIRNDPAEMNDLAAVHPEIRDEMAGLWDEYARTNNVILPDVSPVCPAQE
jgi:arylsulfatase